MIQLQIDHTTGYKYEGKAVASFNEVRMTPAATPEQLVISTRLDVTPSPYALRYVDYWGTMVTAFEVSEAHAELLVRSSSLVQITRIPQQPTGLSWEQLREPGTTDRLCEYLDLGERVHPGPMLSDLLSRVREQSDTPARYARAVTDLVHDQVAYDTSSTQVHSNAVEVWQARSGVCQDLAHLVIGGLRLAGVPARYVSGYLHPSTEAAIGEAVTGESHAWVEWWDGTWVGFDPTNLQTPDEHYVLVGTGRDYNDVAPLSGIYSGAETSAMFVEVSITRRA